MREKAGKDKGTRKQDQKVEMKRDERENRKSQKQRKIKKPKGEKKEKKERYNRKQGKYKGTEKNKSRKWR